MPISRRALEQRFKRALGRSPLQEITRVRLQRARQLLVDTDWDMPYIADHSGFATAAYLSLVFRKELGTTPTAYRRQFRIRGQ